MDLYVGLGDQRHAVRLLQLFYLQHSRAGATFPTYDDDDGNEAAAAKADGGGGRRRARGRRRRRDEDDEGDGGGAKQEQPKPAPEEQQQPKEDDDPRAATDPFYRMVGDTTALDGRVRVFPGVEEEQDGDAAGGAAPPPPARRRLVFARAAVEMGPCSNRHGPAALYFSGVTVPPLVVIAWLKRSFVGRHVQRAFFIPRQQQPAPSDAEKNAAKTPEKTTQNPLDGPCWGGMAKTAEQAANEGWAQAALVKDLDGVRVACSDRRLQAEVLAALEERGAGAGGGNGGDDRETTTTTQQPLRPLRLDPTASATHALCVARVSVADLRAAGTPLPAGDDGAADPGLAERAAARRRELDARRGQVGAVEAAEVAALAAPHRYVWSLAPVAWLYRLAWDEPATHGGASAGGGAKKDGNGNSTSTSTAASALACAHAVHKLDEALRVLGLVSDGTDGSDGLDGRAARSDVTPEERAAWDAYAASAVAAAASGQQQQQSLRLHRALDVGAAPGSWTALMARRILLAEQRRQGQGGEKEDKAAAPIVVAVDPADLDPSCLALPVVKHLRVAAGTDEAARQIREALVAGQAEAAAADHHVDLLACDANTHPKHTLEKLVLPLLPHLRPGGFLVVTLKLHGTGRMRGRVSADCARSLARGGMLPGAALWLMANTSHERTYVAQKREDWTKD